MHIKKTSLRRILKRDLQLNAYKIQLVHEVTHAIPRGTYKIKLISKRGYIEWLPRSPDLTPCVFYVATLNRLSTRTIQEIWNSSKEHYIVKNIRGTTFHQVFQNPWIQDYLVADGYHLDYYFDEIKIPRYIFLIINIHKNIVSFLCFSSYSNRQHVFGSHAL